MQSSRGCLCQERAIWRDVNSPNPILLLERESFLCTTDCCGYNTYISEISPLFYTLLKAGAPTLGLLRAFFLQENLFSTLPNMEVHSHHLHTSLKALYGIIIPKKHLLNCFFETINVDASILDQNKCIQIFKQDIYTLREY